MKKIPIILAVFGCLALTAIFHSCATGSEAVAAKTGAQLWGENCFRCHNTPAPETFSDAEWDVALMHMRVRANLTEDEAEKIAQFMKSAN